MGYDGHASEKELRWREVRRAVIWGASIALAIEVTQLFLPGRFSSLADILANTLGAGSGAWLGSRSKLPAGLLAAVIGGILFVPGILLSPKPPSGTYYGQWTPVFGGMEPYHGRVLQARVGGVAVPSWRSSRSTEIREGLMAGIPVRVKVETGQAKKGEAPVFSIADDRQRGIFMLGVDGDDIFVRIWRLGSTALFQTPTWWWDGALRGVPVGDTVALTYALGDRAPCLNVEGRTRCLTASADLGNWSLVAPDGRRSRLVTGIGLLWAFLLGGPFGMLSLNFRGKILITAGLGAGVATVSSSMPYWVTPWWGILLMFSGMITANLMEPWIRKALEA